MERTTTFIFWNVWILLATPAVWLGWSMIFFCGTILAFVWTTGTTAEIKLVSERRAIAPRVFVTLVFALGVLVFFAVIHSFRSWSTTEKSRHRREVLHGSPKLVVHEFNDSHRGRSDAIRMA